MPSPYERQRPDSRVTPFAREATSAASRDLPIPGGPDIDDEAGRAGLDRALQRLPDRGQLALAADELRVEPPLERRSGGRDLPEQEHVEPLRLAGDLEGALQLEDGSMVDETGDDPPTTISPGSASCWRRAEMPTGSPATKRCPPSADVATTSPAAMPIRISSEMPWSRRAAR